MCFVLYFDMERENVGQGKLFITTFERCPRGFFLLSVINEGRLVTVCSGPFSELGSVYVANGEAMRRFFSGEDIYYVFNPQDLADESIKKTIFPHGFEMK